MISLILLLAVVSFGSHFSKAYFTIMGSFLIQAESISPNQYSLLIVCSTVSSLIFPLVSGLIYDYFVKSRGRLLLVLLAISFCGECILIIYVKYSIFYIGLLSQLLFGIGSSSIVPLQLSLLLMSSSDTGVFGTSTFVSLSHVAKVLGKVTTAPIIMVSSLLVSAAINAGMHILSMIAGFYFCYTLLNSSVDVEEMVQVGNNNTNENVQLHLRPFIDYGSLGSLDSESSNLLIEHKAEELELIPSGSLIPSISSKVSRVYIRVSTDLRNLPSQFWILASAHCLYLLIYHPFTNFLPSFLKERYDMTILKSGYLAGFMSVMVSDTFRYSYLCYFIEYGL